MGKRFSERACIASGLRFRFPVVDLVPFASANGMWLGEFGARTTGREIQAVAKQKAYTGKAEAHVRAVNAQIEELVAQADEARAEIRIEYEKRLETLDPIRKRARAELREIERSADDMLHDLEANVVDTALPWQGGSA
jgi:hypothetical protein